MNVCVCVCWMHVYLRQSRVRLVNFYINTYIHLKNRICYYSQTSIDSSPLLFKKRLWNQGALLLSLQFKNWIMSEWMNKWLSGGSLALCAVTPPPTCFLSPFDSTAFDGEWDRFVQHYHLRFPPFLVVCWQGCDQVHNCHVFGDNLAKGVKGSSPLGVVINSDEKVGTALDKAHLYDNNKLTTQHQILCCLAIESHKRHYTRLPFLASVYWVSWSRS